MLFVEDVYASIYSPSLTLEITKDMELIVNATGYGTLTYDWYHNNSELMHIENTTVLRKRNVSLEDAGSYYCKVCNEDLSCYYTDTVYINVTGNKCSIYILILDNVLQLILPHYPYIPLTRRLNLIGTI